MFELVFLGTSASAPSIYRGLTAQLIIAGEHRFLLDCGEGTQRQILQSGMGFKRLNKVLLTHGHLDHILGLGGLISTLTRWENLDGIDIYAGDGTLERVRNLLYGVVFLGQTPPIPLTLNSLTPGIFFEDKAFTLTAFPVVHQGPGNYGFVFQEKTRRPFLAEKADEMGVPFGPVRSRLVAGEPITLADGRIIDPEEVLGPPIPGVKLVYVGDCGNPEPLREVAAGADCIVMESTYVDAESNLARQFGHLTAGTAARFAKQVGAKALILNHISRRNREYELRQEAQSFFPDTFIARDFDHFIVAKGKPLMKEIVQATEEA
jgi:ribonuclease Z